VNRPVPCKHKGIREFSEIFGETQVKAGTFSRSLDQIHRCRGSGVPGCARQLDARSRSEAPAFLRVLARDFSVRGVGQLGAP